ncbi:amidohydrolase [uncultured Thermanaerothrix sp.]|uniref:amidohydrolase n=1 Tax=uncultured Thermanaerothrix sp. TaxID=1195149 RepID=UPI00261312DE|nr:amidohydrolase [uncultured Thermanaerothrix sp.]
MQALLIEGCDILTVENGAVHFSPRQDILIEGAYIKAIEPTGCLPISNEVERLPAQGLLAIPGLINTHAHVPMVLFRGLAEDVTIEAWFNDYIFPLESNLTSEDVYWGTLLGLAEMIEAGVTYVADHYFFMDEVAQAVSEAGLRANLVWAVFGHEGESKLARTVQFIQRWQGAAEGRITTWLGPHAPYTTTPDFLRLCAHYARDMGVGIHIHVSETAAQVAYSRQLYGKSPIRVLLESKVLEVPTLLAHCLYPEEEDYKILADHPTGIAHAPKTYLKLGMGTAPISRFRSAGIPVGLATDGVVSNNTLDILEQMRLLALTQKDAARDSTVMPIAEVLEIAFEGGARVVQQAGALGALKPGYLADVALLRQDRAAMFPRYNPAANLIYSASAQDVDTVICNGQVLMRDRRLLTLDKTKIKEEVQRRLERLSQRVPGRRIATYPV